MWCIATLLDNKESVKEEVMRAEENILRYEGATQDPHQLLDLIQEIDQQTSNLLFLVARSEDANIYEGKFKALKEGKTGAANRIGKFAAHIPNGCRSTKQDTESTGLHPKHTHRFHPIRR